jgi:hypothetical protein
MEHLKKLKPKIKISSKNPETIENFVNLHSSVPNNCVFELNFNFETLNTYPEILARACGIEMGCIPYDSNAIFIVNSKSINTEVKLHLLFKFNYTIFARDECFDVIKDLVEKEELDPNIILDLYSSNLHKTNDYLKTNRMWDGYSMLGWTLAFRPESKLTTYLVEINANLKVPSEHKDTIVNILMTNCWIKYLSNDGELLRVPKCL